MNARLSWHSSPDAAAQAVMPNSLRAPASRGEAAPCTGQQTSGELFRRHFCPSLRGVLLREEMGTKRPDDAGVFLYRFTTIFCLSLYIQSY